MTILWNEVTILWNEVTIWWNEVTKGWNEVAWNEVVMERSDRNSYGDLPVSRQRICMDNPVSSLSVKRESFLAAVKSNSTYSPCKKGYLAFVET